MTVAAGVDSSAVPEVIRLSVVGPLGWWFILTVMAMAGMGFTQHLEEAPAALV